MPYVHMCHLIRTYMCTQIDCFLFICFVLHAHFLLFGCSVLNPLWPLVNFKLHYSVRRRVRAEFQLNSMKLRIKCVRLQRRQEQQHKHRIPTFP